MGAVTPVPMTILVVLAKAAPYHGHAAPPDAPLFHHGI